MSKKISLNVLAGQRRETVGTIVAQVGMLTSGGHIERITPAGTVFTDRGPYRGDKAKSLTVRHTEALKYGYPHASGCNRIKIRTIRRGEQSIAA